MRLSNITVAMLVAMLIAAGIAVFGEQDPSPSTLPELPASASAKLRLFGGRAVASTTARIPIQTPPPAPTPCAADSTATFYTVRVTTPITLCPDLSQVAWIQSNIMPTGSPISRNKLSKPGPGMAAGSVPGVTLHFPLLCMTSNGPWDAEVESDRMCSGLCSPQNRLSIVGIPATVEFFWAGSVFQPPAGATFKYASRLTQVDSEDLGRCHAQ